MVNWINDPSETWPDANAEQVEVEVEPAQREGIVRRIGAEFARMAASVRELKDLGTIHAVVPNSSDWHPRVSGTLSLDDMIEVAQGAPGLENSRHATEQHKPNAKEQ